MIDARRMECYTMIVDSDLNILRDTHADILDDNAQSSPLTAFLEKSEVTFIGDGAAKTRDVLGRHPNARYDDSFILSAEGMTDLAIKKLQHGETEDVAYFEPFYLKDFVAKKSVVHGLR
jgi:tRNA threonylcarbamoyladenosine biosynthesis protein TsaB